MLQRAASNAYSWWWASHIRTKQSRWLDNDLQEMEGRVKSMLKIIEEDADSFAQRAEMYYKRRPELINYVEEAYRAYRALADRYDHISGELHKANHTIATAFPDHVQFETQDEDEYTSPKDVSQINTTKIPRPPATIPQVSFRNKTRKIQSTPKKPHCKIIDSVEKAKAQEEIDKIQKRILVLQTEKEFIKSSYENGLTKYWDIEKQIAEMQEEVFHLQSEFNASSVIEDDEARALMAATALKSCEDTLINLQEQQKRSSELARIESRRIEDAKEKLKVLKGDSGRSQFEAGESFNENKEAGELISSTDEEVYLQERHELDSICEKIREYFEMSSDMSVGELAEKIDNLVNKVISLEVIVSSQTVQIDRLKSETDELQKHLYSLEVEKLNLLGDSNTLSDKLRQAEEELIRIQDLEKCVQDEKKALHTHFTEARVNLNELSEKLQSPKHENVVSSVKAFKDGEVSLGECNEREEIDSQDTREDVSFGDKAQHIREPGINQKGRDDPLINVTTSAFENDSEKLRDPEQAISGIQDLKDNIDEEPHGVSASVFSPKDKGIQVQSEIECQLENDSKILEDSREEVTKILKNQDSLSKEEVHMSWEVDLGLVPQENQILAREGSQIDNVPEQSKVPEKEITTIQNKGDNLTKHKDHVIQEHNRSPRDEENHFHRVESGKQELGADFFKDLKQENEIEEKDSTQAEESIHLSSVPVTQLCDQEGSLNWQQLLLNGLEGREKILLNEYTSILRNYKETKKRLCEAERKNQDYHFEMMAEIGELKSANAVKDEEILFLRQKLSSLQVSNNENSVAPLMEVEDPKHGKVEKISSFPRLMAVSSSSRRLFSRTFKGINVESEASRDALFNGFIENPLAEDGIKLVHFGEPPKNSALEEKFRRDIDTLLEENLDFWLRFSTTFHHVQKFQTTFEDLQSEIEKLKSNKTQEGSSNGSSGHSGKSESAPIEKQLRELKTELQVWLEQNAMLRGELQKRFASICNIQEEITNVLKSSESEVVPFTPYQAAKFQGEVLNMQQENNKVADELQLGLDHVSALQLEIEKTLLKLRENSDVHGSRSSHHHYHIRNFSSKTILPLRALVFGAKPKKPSIFQCMNPALQKQYSDLRAAGLKT